MLNLIAGILCLGEGLFFAVVDPRPLFILMCAVVGGLNIAIWEHNQ